MANVLVISAPDLSHRFHVATDASATGIAGILYQVINNEIKHIAMVSRKLSPSERNYSVTKRELFAVIYSFSKFHKWLDLIPFTLHTDHRNLIYLNTQKSPNALMLGWWESIFSYTFTCVYLPGISNLIPDVLSRLYPDEEVPLLLEGGSCADVTSDGSIIKKKNKRKSKELALPKKSFLSPLLTSHALPKFMRQRTSYFFYC